MSPLEFMQRLAALVPRPKLQLIRFHGVLAPTAQLRSLVGPEWPPVSKEPAAEAALATECEVEIDHHGESSTVVRGAVTGLTDLFGASGSTLEVNGANVEALLATWRFGPPSSNADNAFRLELANVPSSTAKN